MTRAVQGDARHLTRWCKLDNAVAVVADRFWRAKKAVDSAEDRMGPRRRGRAPTARNSPQAYRDALDGPAATARNDGDADEAMHDAAKRIEALYEVPYLAHATMEPLNATAHYQPDRLDVWIGTQNALADTDDRGQGRRA